MASACFFARSWLSERAAAICLRVTVAPAFGAAAAFGVFAADLAAAGAFFAAMANDSLLKLSCTRTESCFFLKNKHFLRLGDSGRGSFAWWGLWHVPAATTKGEADRCMMFIIGQRPMA